MANVNIRLNIGDRFYPLVIPEEQEANLRAAARIIGERMKEYQESYAVKDKQDLLAMTALFFANASLEHTSTTERGDNRMASLLTELEMLLEPGEGK